MNIDGLFWKILLFALLVWLVQVSPFLLGFILNGGFENSTLFVYRGEIGFSQDLMVYAAQIKHAYLDPNIFRSDALIFENQEKFFPDGNIIILYCASFYYLLGSWDGMLVLSCLPCIVISSFILYKIVKHILKEQTSFIFYVLLGCFVFFTEFSDFLGLFKLMESLLNNSVFVPGFNKLIMGYAQRFPQTQISTVIFLWWILNLLNVISWGRNNDYLLLAISLVILQYTYFFYWTFALGFSTLFLIPQWLKSPKPWLMLLVYVVGTMPFWLYLYHFYQSSFAEEYQLKMRGYQTYPNIIFHLVGIASIAFIYLKSKNAKSIFIILLPLGMQLAIQLVLYVFPSDSIYYLLIQYGSLLFFLFVFFTLMYNGKYLAYENLLIINYFATFILINLKFYLGFNVQPFHWVHIAFYPILLIGLLPIGITLLNKVSHKIIKALSFFIVLLALSNGVIFATSMRKFWQISSDEKQVYSFITKQKKGVIGGNNIAFCITSAVHTPHKLINGISHTNYLSNDESYYRLIKNFKTMGYTNFEILKEVHQYQKSKEYKANFVWKNASLAKTWPDNTTLFAESVCHYFENPANYIPEFERALKNYTEGRYKCRLDYLLIYKSTYRGDYEKIAGKLIFENKSYKIYQTLIN